MTKKIVCPDCGSDKYKPMRHDLIRKKGKDGHERGSQVRCLNCYRLYSVYPAIK